MEKKFKKIIPGAVAAVLGMGILAAAVGRFAGHGMVADVMAAEDQGETDVYQNAGTDLLFWYEDEAYRDFFEAAARDYFEETGIKVQVKAIDTLDYFGDIYDTTMQEGEFPDVYMTSGDNLEEAYLYGLAEPNRKPEAYETASKQAMAAAAYRDKIYGYPLSFHSCVFVYQNGYFDGQPDSLQAIIDYSNENEPPENVEYLLEWDVNDPYYDFPFIANSVTFEKTESKVMNVVYDEDLYEQDLAYFEQILESFSIAADTVSEESILEHFLEGKTLCAIIDTSHLRLLSDYNYSLMLLPDLNESLDTNTCAITDMLLVNPFSENGEQAADFAVFVTTKEREALREYVGDYSVLIPEEMDMVDEVAYAAYESAVLMPDSQDARDFWIRLEATIHKYF